MAAIKDVFTPYKTKKPTGLDIVRNGAKFTVSWKKGDKDYGGGQSVQYSINGGDWKKITVSASATKASLTVTLTNYKPSTSKVLSSVAFRVKGLRSAWNETKKNNRYLYAPIDSDWASCTFDILTPEDPKLTVTPTVNNNTNQTKFQWTTAATDSNKRLVRDCEYQAVLIQNSSYTKGSDVPWKSSTPGWQTNTSTATGGQVTITENSSITSGSYTRWFRVRARGSHAESAWIYGKHVYAAPNAPTITDYKFTKKSTGNGGTVMVKWTSSAPVSRPIDQIAVEWAVGMPSSGGAPPANPSWQDGVTLANVASGGTSFEVSDIPEEDEGLYVRVVAKHDNRSTPSTAVWAAKGTLPTPTSFSVSVNTSTSVATFTATNPSDVPGSFIACRYIIPGFESFGGGVVAVIPHGSTSASKNIGDIAQKNATFTATTTVGEYHSFGGFYEVVNYWESAPASYGTSVPAAPTDVVVSQAETMGTAKVSWTWAWSAATFAELSWSDREDAWESTNDPDSYTIDRRTESWKIAGLDAGVTYYIRVRLGRMVEDVAEYSQYSKAVTIKLASAPVIPVLEVSPGVITAKGSVECSWVYVTGDGTPQGSAIVAEVSGSTYTPIYTATSEQHATISAAAMGWTTGSTHQLAVRVTSGSGQVSDEWSVPVTVSVAAPMTATISATSFTNVTEDGRTFKALSAMPLTATITGAGNAGITKLIIERAAAYHVDRPDESITNGYEGEAIAIYSQMGESQITISNDDLIGSLDDGAQYRLIAITQDGLGQSAEVEQLFEVRWTDQAKIPQGTAQVDEDNAAVIITPVAPSGTPQTATCDIYRLSVDKPVLIYRGASFGTSYVDPFPTIGEYGGHRLVYRTANGDYITSTNELAWLDLRELEDDYIESDYNIIDWETGRVEIEYNVDVGNSWSKDFTETKYLGGSVQGDWNPAVSRTGSVNAVAIATDDQELIQNLRRLAVYPGICHVRTKEGSSYSANVDVSEDVNQDSAHKIVEFSLKITRVDTQGLDGMTLDQWHDTHED